MADNNFRASRGRDSAVGDDDNSPAREAAYDPLAELARLIGQAGPAAGSGSSPRHDSRDRAAELAPAAPAAAQTEWAAEPDYAEPALHEEDRYTQPRTDDRYTQPPDEEDYAAPPLAEPYLPAQDFATAAQDFATATQDFAAAPQDYAPQNHAAYERGDQPLPPPAERYADEPESYRDPRDDQPRYDARYRDETQPARSAGRQLPSLAPQAYDDDYADEDEEEQWPVSGGDGYAEDRADDAPRARPRRGLIIMAIVGLVLFGGAASVFAYRATYGGSILPSLPPIIKAGDGPIKINPAQRDGQADPSSLPGNRDTGVKLLTRQEQPVDVPPPNAAPRVVQTIPVMPGTPSGAPAVAPQSAPGGVFPPTATTSPFPPPPASSSFPQPAALPSVVPPPPAATAPPTQASTPTSTEPRKVHTLSIRPDQAASAHVATAGTVPPPRQLSPPPPAARTAPAPETRTGTGAPLSLVPNAHGEARPSEPPPPPRNQVARVEPHSAPMATTPVPAEAAATSTGGYAVQVTSQRSEAEAQAAYRSLRSKYPGQIGNRAPIIRRADLGEKGTFYRAMIGPFGSREEAVQMCANLKAAGGSCLIAGN